MSLFGRPDGYRFRPMRRPAPARTRPLLGPDFPGGRFPIGSPVSFEHRGATHGGEVTALQERTATVVDTGRSEWTVPYSLLRRDPGAPEPRVSLAEADRIGRNLIRHHTEAGELQPGWEFGFDLAEVRAATCRFSQRQITLSVTYCTDKDISPDKIRITILHEITHAIVGYDHHHDAIWKATNLRLGGDGKRCHEVEHTPPRWVGLCGCGNHWQRHRLSRRARTGVCPKCRGRIRWQRHVGGFVGNGADDATGDTRRGES